MRVLVTNLRLSLNDKVIGQLPTPDEGQYVVRDVGLKGFYLLVGKKRRTYIVHGDLKRPGERATSIKVSVGDAADLTATKARLIAKGYLSEMGQGRHPKPPAVKAAPEVVATNTAAALTAADSGISLRAAWERYHTALIRKKRSDGTIAGYRDHVERVFKAWLDTPLRELGDDPAPSPANTMRLPRLLVPTSPMAPCERSGRSTITRAKPTVSFRAITPWTAWIGIMRSGAIPVWAPVIYPVGLRNSPPSTIRSGGNSIFSLYFQGAVRRR